MASNSKVTKAKRKIRDDKLQLRRTRKSAAKLKKLEEEGKLLKAIL